MLLRETQRQRENGRRERIGERMVEITVKPLNKRTPIQRHPHIQRYVIAVGRTKRPL